MLMSPMTILVDRSGDQNNVTHSLKITINRPAYFLQSIKLLSTHANMFLCISLTLSPLAITIVFD